MKLRLGLRDLVSIPIKPSQPHITICILREFPQNIVVRIFADPISECALRGNWVDESNSAVAWEYDEWATAYCLSLGFAHCSNVIVNHSKRWSWQNQKNLSFKSTLCHQKFTAILISGLFPPDKIIPIYSSCPPQYSDAGSIKQLFSHIGFLHYVVAPVLFPIRLYSSTFDADRFNMIIINLTIAFCSTIVTERQSRRCCLWAILRLCGALNTTKLPRSYLTASRRSKELRRCMATHIGGKNKTEEPQSTNCADYFQSIGHGMQ